MLLLLLVACAQPEPPEVPGGGDDDDDTVVIPDNLGIENVRLNGMSVVYDGERHSLAITGSPSDSNVTVKYENNGKTDAGEYTVTAKFYYKDKYIEGKDKTAKLVILRADFDSYEIYFNGMSVFADGNPHTIEVSGQLPRGVDVVYEGNGQSEVGEHTVTASFVSNNYNCPAPMTAKLRILESVPGIEGISITDTASIYSGGSKAWPQYSGTPSGNISFAGYDAPATIRNAGSYTVTARFAVGGVYDPKLDLSATVTVKPERLFVSAEDKVVDYDGNYHSIELVWREPKPDAVTVIAEGNGRRYIGSNKVVFDFTLSEEEKGNYLLTTVEAMLTVRVAEDFATEGLVIELQSGTYVVTGYTGTDTAVIIPSKYKGTSVTRIDDSAFAGNTSIEYVYMGDRVTQIGNRAFRGCTSLEVVRMGDSVNIIGSLSFESTALKDVVIPNAVRAIDIGAFRNTPVESITIPFIGGSRVSSNDYFGYIFGGGNRAFVPESLKTVIVSDSCELIPAYAFMGCDSIECVIIGSGVKEIGNNAFRECSSLKSIYIPLNVKKIQANANDHNSPFYLVGEDFIIALEAEEASINFGSKWCALDDGVYCEPYYGVTYEEYLELVNIENA